MGSSGGVGVPPGFRFHPTDEELLHYYLKKKVTFQKFDMEVIREVDLNKMEPWDLQERCRIGPTPQNEWYFFSHKDRKYPTGSRTNRATNAGFWKATGRDKCIRNTFKKIGMRKTLVFYRGRAPHGQKTDWIMHEFRLEEAADSDPQGSSSEDGWVVCRVFKKKNLFKVSADHHHGGGGSSLNSAEHHQHHQHHHSNININSSNNSNTNLAARSLMLRESQYHLLMRPLDHHQNQELTHSSSTTDLALHYPNNIPTNHYSSLFQSQTSLIPISTNPSPPLGNYELSMCSDHNNNHQVNDQAGMNEWGMLDRLVTTHVGNEDSSKDQDQQVGFDRDGNNNDQVQSVHQINQLPLRGEMDFWGYGK